MKKILTFLTLLTLSIGVGWAATVTYSLTPDKTSTGLDNTSYITTLTEFTYNNVSWKMDQWNPSTLQIKTNQSSAASEFRFYNTSAIPGRITKVVLKFSALTLSNTSTTGFMFVGGSSEVTATSGGTNGTWNNTAKTITWTPGASTNYTYFAFYQNGKVATGTNKLATADAIVVTYEGAEPAETPTFTPGPGTYTEAQTVTISSATSGATIYYTTNGEDPTTSSNIYSSPITVSSTTTIKAMAVKSGMNNSNIATAKYTFPGTVSPTYEEPFESTFGKFYMEDKTGSGIWNLDASYHYAKASGFISGLNTASESWLISPFIDLSDASNPELSFSHAGNFFTSSAVMQSDVAIKVKKKGEPDDSWSDLTVNTWPEGTNWTFVNNTTLLEDYAGEIIQIAFVYTSTTERAGTWEIKNIVVEDLSAPKYYLYGTFNGWNTEDANYEFNLSNGIYSITGVDLPDNVRFKISKVVNGQVTEYGAANGGADYGIKGDWHNNLPMDGADAYTIASGALTNITLNTTNMTFDVSRDAQFFVKGDFNGWNREAMTSTASGWTIEHVISSANQFGFVDEWGYWYGGRDWWINEEHLDTELEIKPDGNFYMNIAGTDDYTLTVNSDKSKLIVTRIVVVVGGDYELVTDASTLSAGDRVIITNSKTAGTANAMGADRGNNRGAAEITITSDIKITPGSDVQILSLEGDASCWYFNAGDNTYLRADGGSSNNYLKTGAMHNNAKASITSGTNDIAEIVFQIEGNRKYLRYNGSNNPPIFSCYESGKQSPVYLFKKMGSEERATPPVITPASQNVKGGLLEGVMITAAEGATIRYTLDGSEPTVDSPVFDGQAFNITGAGGERKMVRAIAVEANKAPSYPASVTYTFQAPATPTISPAAGTYDEAVTVTITSTDGGTIYYLVDPEEAPTNAAGVITAGQVYTEGETEIILSKNGTHKVYAAVDLNGITSWAQASYTINLPATSLTLAGILEEKQPGKTYTVSDELIAVAVGFDGSSFILWCKDQYDEGEDPTSIDAVENENNYIDYMKKHGGFEGEWDQSNWIALRFLTDDGGETDMSLDNIIAFYDELKNHEGWRIKAGTITGDLSLPAQPYLSMNIDLLNPEIPFEFETNGNVGYDPNLYSPANFLYENLDSQAEGGNGAIGVDPSTGEDIHYFFMTPKVNEICDITFAVWNGSYFTLPKPKENQNNTNIPGAFKAEMYFSELVFTNDENEPIKEYDPTDDLEPGQAYKFRAAIGYNADPGVVPMKGDEGYESQDVNYDQIGYRVYPIDFDPMNPENIVTGIENVNVFEGNSYVKSIKYVNVAGMVSDTPFQGVNIVVIEKTDGSKTTYKMIKK